MSIAIDQALLSQMLESLTFLLNQGKVKPTVEEVLAIFSESLRKLIKLIMEDQIWMKLLLGT